MQKLIETIFAVLVFMVICWVVFYVTQDATGGLLAIVGKVIG